MDKIKWIKLKRIAEEVTNKKVEFVASTHITDYRAFVICDKHDNITVYFNMEYAKDIKLIIISLAHELAHVVLMNDAHDNQFEDEKEKLITKITKNYNKEELCA